jgi:hypothetical protein
MEDKKLIFLIVGKNYSVSKDLKIPMFTILQNEEHC